MEPKIKTGSVVFVQKIKPGTLKKDDVITYASVEDPDILITHRLTAIEEKEGKTIFKTRGDANNSEDMGEVSSSQIKGKVIFSLPFLGYLSVWIREPKGFGLLVVLPAVLIILSEILNIKKAIEEEVEKKYKNKKNGKLKIVLLFIFLNCNFFGFGVRSTNAYFSNTLVSSGNTFSTGWWADNIAPISEIPVNSLELFYNNHDFPVDYFAEDEDGGSGVKEVRLYYSHNLSDWVLLGEASIPNEFGNGSFNFTSPLGDGVYDFKAIAVDNAGNTEEKYIADASTQVDTEVPYTNLSLGEFGDDDIVGNRFAVNEQMVNGNFEDTNDPERGWIWDGDGEHRVVDNTDLGSEAKVKAGDNSALIGWLDIGPTSNGIDYLYQTISVPDTSATLSFWYRVLSDDIVDYDYFEAKIVDVGGTKADEVIIKTGSDEIGGWWGDSLWQEITYSLDNWLSSTVQLWFSVINHDEVGWPLKKTATIIDDVRITNSDNFVTTDKEMELANNDIGSGIKTTWYRINGGDWIEYVGAFNPYELGIVNGTTGLIEYYSVDLAGNKETTRSLELTTDDSKSYFGLVLNKISPWISTSVVGSTGLPLDGVWVELWNNSNLAIDVTGYVLREGGGSYLPIILSNSDNDGDLSDGGEIIVPAGGWLRVYRNGDSDFSLNTGGDTVMLYTDYLGNKGQLVDSYDYKEVSAVDKVWARIPDGTGTWADPEENKEIEVEVKSTGENKIILSILNIPENYSENGNLFEYELTYIDKNNLEKGIAGQILPEVVKEDRANQELYLGTCSAEGACIPDVIKDGAVYLTIIQGEIIIVDNRQFKI